MYRDWFDFLAAMILGGVAVVILVIRDLIRRAVRRRKQKSAVRAVRDDGPEWIPWYDR